MKILITGADVLFNELSNVYDVIYRGRKVYSNRMKNSAIIFALNREKLTEALGEVPTSNVIYINAKVG